MAQGRHPASQANLLQGGQRAVRAAPRPPSPGAESTADDTPAQAQSPQQIPAQQPLDEQDHYPDEVGGDDEMGDDQELAMIDNDDVPDPDIVAEDEVEAATDDEQEEEEDTAEWQRYEAAMQRRELLVARIHDKRWVVQDWDPVRHTEKNTYYHLSTSAHPPETAHCDCPSAATAACVHVTLFTEHMKLADDNPRCLMSRPPIVRAENGSVPEVVAFDIGNLFQFAFSVRKSPEAHDSGKRVVVVKRKSGNWWCAGSLRGCRGTCGHIWSAVACLEELDLLPGDDLELAGEGPLVEDELERQERVGGQCHRSPLTPPVSHLPRGPSDWLRTKSAEDAAFPPYRSYDRPPSLIELDEGARCRCGRTRIGNEVVQVSSFTVFGHRGAKRTKVETVACSKCTRRRIGPDMLRIGIVNVNNVIGFRRELFDSYLNQFHKSETPINAFHKSVVAEYTRCPIDFVSESTFRRTLFAFCDLHQIGSGMSCPHCGSSPKFAICDGSYFAFESKRLTGGLRPPTVPTSKSKNRSKVTAIDTAPLPSERLGITSARLRDLRKEIGAFVRITPGTQAPVPASLKTIIEECNRAEGSLGQALERVLRLLGRCNGTRRRALCRLIRQLLPSTGLFALVPPPVIADMNIYVETGEFSSMLAQAVPIFDGPMVRLEAIRNLFRVLLGMAQTAWTDMLANAATEDPLSAVLLAKATAKDHNEDDPNSWRTSGSAYGSQKLRSRPFFSGLPNDAGERRVNNSRVKDGADTAEACAKYYDTYGKKNGMIGALFGFWCPHAVCVGFHIMPTSEGRDDAFSGLFCHWPEAPEVVIYDYSCQLREYCLRRAPEFFKNTRFYVDELHARGHKDCATLSHLSSAMSANPDLRDINSSIAECAHASLGRIRKSMSYMNEMHATLYLWTAIQIRNRARMLKCNLAQPFSFPVEAEDAL